MAKGKVTPDVIRRIYELKRACFNNLEVCQHLAISESTLYDWLSSSSPRFHSEFSESYQRGITDSKTGLKDLATSALIKSIQGAKTEQIHYDANGTITKRIVKENSPSVGHLVSLLQSLAPEFLSKSSEPTLTITVPPITNGLSFEEAKMLYRQHLQAPD